MLLRGAAVAAMMLASALAAPGVSRADPPATWAAHLQAADLALMRGDHSDAAHEWHQALSAVLRSRTWLGLLEVGDAYLRLAEAGSLPASAKPVARSLYLEALVQAKSQRSSGGVLRVAAAFERLGDRDAAAQCLRAAESVARAGRDAPALRDVAAARERLGPSAHPAPRGRGMSALLDRGWAVIRSSWRESGH